MKIIPLISIHTKVGLFQPGMEVDLPSDEARSLVERELAIPAPKEADLPSDEARSLVEDESTTGSPGEVSAAAPPSDDVRKGPKKR